MLPQPIFIRGYFYTLALLTCLNNISQDSLLAVIGSSIKVRHTESTQHNRRVTINFVTFNLALLYILFIYTCLIAL